jgi:hypothetical protein
MEASSKYAFVGDSIMVLEVIASRFSIVTSVFGKHPNDKRQKITKMSVNLVRLGCMITSSSY